MRALIVVAALLVASDARADRTVTGVVLDDAGQPIVGALVAVGTGEAATDDTGRFEVTNVPFGRHDVVVIADGYRAYFGSARIGADMKIRLAKDDSAGEVIHISGRVP